MLEGLVNNYVEGGGGYKTGGGACEVLPIRKGEERGLGQAEGGGGAQQVLGWFLRGSSKL